MPRTFRSYILPAFTGLVLFAGCGSRESAPQTPPPASQDAPRKASAAPASPVVRGTPGAYKWDGQTISVTFNAPLAKAASAAQGALKKTGFTEEHLAKASSVDFTSVEAATKAGIVARVELRSLGNRTDAKVRVGEVGDEPASERILDEMAQVLGAK
jgi:hypothetical protein